MSNSRHPDRRTVALRRRASLQACALACLIPLAVPSRSEPAILADLIPDPAPLAMAWDSGIGHTYRVEAASQPGGPWSPVAALTARSLRARWTPGDPGVTGIRLFRIRSLPGPPEAFTVEGLPLPPGSIGIELLGLGAGHFPMGSPAEETGRGTDEGPVHQVLLRRPYWMSRHEVTQAQFEALMGFNPSGFRSAGPDAPVESVAWDEAAAFCERLTTREQVAGRLPTGYSYRLPTEAEWEHACRAGTTGSFSHGSGGLSDFGWYSDNAFGSPRPVGTRRPNPWGFHDLHGNVWEWCLDDRRPYPADATGFPAAIPEPLGPDGSDSRAVRGGGWHEPAAQCRSANRARTARDTRGSNLGFRIVCAPDPRHSPVTGSLSLPALDPGPESAPLELLRLPAGTFWMGSDPGEAGREVDEGPRHRATITRGFWMARTEITRAQYSVVMSGMPDPGGSGDRPVTGVRWGDATAFCERLTALERAAGRLPQGHVYRLPTEAEWEYACRAGTATRFAHGDDPELRRLDRFAVWGGGPGGVPATVADRAANPWGLFDLHGNVREWCADRAGAYPRDDVTDPAGPDEGDLRIVRGGAWISGAPDCRSAARAAMDPELSAAHVGFRVVCAPASDPP